MGKLLSGAAVLALCLVTGGAVAQDPSFTLGVDCPDSVAVGDEITIDLTLTSADIDGDAGPQGWSLGLANEGIDITAVTWAGTASANVPDGGFANGGFQVAEVIDPANDDQGQGCVSAIVLSFVTPATLPPNSTQVVLKADYTAAAGGAATLEYRNGLRGSGQPVSNDITFGGQTATPGLGSCTFDIIEIGPEDTLAACHDGTDNDQDGDMDCDDADCAAFCVEGPFGDPSCDDGVDNDGDGDTDADDDECAPPPEGSTDAAECSDGIDNDGDGDTDCDDADCAGVIEEPNCDDDGVDNDCDGDVDECVMAPMGLFAAAPADCALLGTEFDVVLSVGPGDPADLPADGAQGWSLGLEHDGDVITGVGEPTIEGTVAGDITSGGFSKSEFVDPARNEGRNGLVSAVVLSFTQPIKLDPAVDQSILIATYVSADGVTVAEGESVSTDLTYANGLRGSGQPVDTVLTVEGATVDAVPGVGTGTTVCLVDVPPIVIDVFIRGDSNDDGKVDIADPIWTINMLVRSGPASPCMRAGDSNGDGMVDLSDAMYTIEYRFLAGPAPIAPFPECGELEAIEGLSCEASACP